MVKENKILCSLLSFNKKSLLTCMLVCIFGSLLGMLDGVIVWGFYTNIMRTMIIAESWRNHVKFMQTCKTLMPKINPVPSNLYIHHVLYFPCFTLKPPFISSFFLSPSSFLPCVLSYSSRRPRVGQVIWANCWKFV